MLNGINTSGRYLTVMGGSSTTYVSKSYGSNSHMQGDMRYDLDSQCIKVFDGSSWQSMVSSMATLELTYEAQSLLDWAREKKNEESAIKELAKTSVAIKDLLDQIEIKKDQIKMVQTLIKSPGHDAEQSVAMQAS